MIFEFVFGMVFVLLGILLIGIVAIGMVFM